MAGGRHGRASDPGGGPGRGAAAALQPGAAGDFGGAVGLGPCHLGENAE